MKARSPSANADRVLHFQVRAELEVRTRAAKNRLIRVALGMAPAAKLRRFPTCAKVSASKKRAESGPGAEYNGDLSKADDAAGSIPGDDASAAAGHQAPAIFQRRANRFPPRRNGAQSPARVRGTGRRRRAHCGRAPSRGDLWGSAGERVEGDWAKESLSTDAGEYAEISAPTSRTSTTRTSRRAPGTKP